IVDNAWIKHSKDLFRAPTAQDMEILIQTCLMLLAIKTQNDSFKFVHGLKQEMHADLKYVESLEKEIDELKSNKAEFSDMYDGILVLYENTNKAWKWWIERQSPSGYKWVPKPKKQWVPKHMTGNLKLLCNFVEKFLGTVHFGNDQFARILGYGDLVQGNATINRVYYVEGLNHNLFSVGQFCDADLETTPTQAWLGHRRLSHLNFDYINLLLKKDIVIGLPKLKYVKDQLCSSCELSKAKRSSFKSKVVPSSKGRLNLLHMDLCGPIRVASINRKKYILVWELVDKPFGKTIIRLKWLWKNKKDEDQTVIHNKARLLAKGYAQEEVESIHIRFDEIKEVSETYVANNTSGLVPQRQKASDYDNPDPVSQRQDVFSLADANVSSQQELDLLFGPLYDKFFNAAKQAVSNTNVLKLVMYRIDNRTAHTRAPQLPQTVRNTNPHVSTSTRVNHKPNVNRPQIKSNQSRDKVLPNNSQVKSKKTQVEVHPRIPSVSNKMKSVTMCKDSLNSRTLNANVVCATCNKCLVDSNHFACFTKMLNGVHARTKKPTVIVQLIFIVDSGYTKHMTGNLKLLCNFVEKFLGTVHFGNDQFAPILGYGDLVQGNATINRVYYVEGLNHNLFSVGQFCDADLETTPTQAWLGHRRLSHLNFDYINLLSKKDIVIGLPKLKYVKDQLCSSCELSKAKRSSFKSKVIPSSRGRLNLLHMDLCGPIRVASINGKKYILVIVDDYSRYTWTLFLRSKDETPEVLN
nr:hypothetical protein [Tanacetum cinerariifolium]